MLLSVTPGFGGRALIEEVLEKARDLTRFRAGDDHAYLIEIDGGVKLENAALAADAGCDVVVLGSAVFGDSNPAEYLMKLRKRLNERSQDSSVIA